MSFAQYFSFVLITKTCSDDFGLWTFAKMFLCFDNFTCLATLNFRSLSIFSTWNSKYVLDAASIGFNLTALWYTLLNLSIIFSNLPIYAFCDFPVIHLYIFMQSLEATKDFPWFCVE